VLLDDVHEAGPDLSAQLLRLVQLDAARETLTLVLATRAAQAPRLGEQLLELVDLRIDLEPWGELDTVGYLQLALVEAGCERPLFDDDSLAEIHRLTSGVPRQVNRLAEHALWAGAAGTPEIIDTAAIRAAHAELTGRARG
jgi:type II secretory pathway predicted ATPase ExeA